MMLDISSTFLFLLFSRIKFQRYSFVCAFFSRVKMESSPSTEHSVKPKERRQTLPPPVPSKPVGLLRKNLPPPVPPKPSSRPFNVKSTSKEQSNSTVPSKSISDYSMDTGIEKKPLTQSNSSGGFLFTQYLTNPNRYEETDDYSSFDDDDFSDDESINTATNSHLYLHVNDYPGDQFIAQDVSIEGDSGRGSLNQPEFADLQSEEETDFGNLLEGNERKAYFVAKEIASSERVFVDSLRLICTDFRAAVTSKLYLDADDSLPIISEVELNQIIGNLSYLKKLNEELLNDFEERLKNWIVLPKIADVLLHKGPFLKLFSAYIQNFERQSHFFDECVKKYHRFRQTMKDFEYTPI